MAEEEGRRSPENAFTVKRSGRDQTLTAIQHLETSLGRASGSEGWLAGVRSDVDALLAAMAGEQEHARRPDDLMAMIAAENPRRFSSRVDHLRAQYDDMMRHVESLWNQLDGVQPEQVDVTDLRHRLGWVLQSIHQYRARQTDLVYEAIQLDLGDHNTQGDG